MSKHTKGPWKRSGRGIAAKTRMICVQSVADEECDANARLIAAAPEMLEALKRVSEVFPQNEELFETIRKLIAKAEGGDHE